MYHHLTPALADARIADLHRQATRRVERAAQPGRVLARPRHAVRIDRVLQIGGRRSERRRAA
jgi:hypothetical protein